MKYSNEILFVLSGVNIFTEKGLFYRLDMINLKKVDFSE